MKSSSFGRAGALLFGGIFVLVAALTARAATLAQKPINLLFIMTDQQR